MPSPDFQSLMLPALKALADGTDTPISDVRDRIVASLGLKPENLQERLPSGRQSVFANRVSWAIVYMEHAGLVERVRRGVYRLTDEGKQLLVRAPERIDKNLLLEYPGYVEWRSNRMTTPSPGTNLADIRDSESKDTPEEALDLAVAQIRKTLEADVLDRVRNATPKFLERVVINLLIAMGYGGGEAAMGDVTGRSGDGGIDGKIKEDALGLDEVYIQAKKYAEGNTVGESDLRNFAGAIDAAGTTKGVFVTTADFTPSARKYVERSPKRIILIDGKELARLMVQHHVGVRTQIRYEIKRIDEDYFDQETW